MIRNFLSPRTNYNLKIEDVSDDLRPYHYVIALIADFIKGTKFENKMYVVGGYLRDRLLGYCPKDVDIFVDVDDHIKILRLVELITKKFHAKNNLEVEDGAVPFVIFKGLQHRGVSFDDVKVDFVTHRYNLEKREYPTRQDKLRANAFMCDFTINSLFENICTQELLDFTGLGLSDIKEKMLRTSMPGDRLFLDDPTRLMRGVYFATRYELKIESCLIRSFRRNAYLLNNVSPVNLQRYLNKILMTHRPAYGLRLLKATKLSRYFFPELGIISKKDYKSVLNGLDQAPLKLEDRLKAFFRNLDNVPSIKARLIIRLLKDCKNDLTSYSDLNVAKNTMTFLSYSPEQVAAVTGLPLDSVRTINAINKKPVFKDI